MFSIDGLASGLDTTNLINQILGLERRPITLIQGQVEQAQGKQAAYLDLSARLLSMQISARRLADPDFFQKYRGHRDSWRKVKENIERALADDTLEHIMFDIADISGYKIRDEGTMYRTLNKLKTIFPSSKRLSFRSRRFHNGAAAEALCGV